MKNIFLFVSIFTIAQLAIKANIVTYNYQHTDANLPASAYYQVQLIDGDNIFAPLVYMSKSNAESNGRNQAILSNTISWTSFSFSESVKVRVSIKSGQSKVSYSSCTILPSRFGIETTKINDSTAEFTITRPGQYSVEFGSNGYKNGLMIFADPLEDNGMNKSASSVYVCNPCTAADVNSISSAYNSVYFENTYHLINIWNIPAHIKNIYLAPGSVVRGMLKLSGSSDSNVKIYGRGTLDGRSLSKENAIEAVSGANNITVEGLIISQSTEFAVRLLGSNNEIHWVKTPGGWNFNNDGLVGYDNTHISHCFVWANDDGIKLYRDNQNVHDIVAWHLTNGGVFQWCWNSVSAKNIRVKDVDVLHGMWPADGNNQGVFNVRGSSTNNGVGVQEDWIFENIKVETPVKVLFRLTPQYDHIVRDVTFLNVDASVTSDVTNKIDGNNGYPISNISIENLKMNNVCIDESNATTTGRFVIGSYTSNISFSADDCTPTFFANEKYHPGFTLYPNPASNILHIDSDMNFTGYKIIDISGRVVESHQLVTNLTIIQIDKLPKGVYLLQLNTGKAFHSQRFIK